MQILYYWELESVGLVIRRNTQNRFGLLNIKAKKWKW